MASTPIRNTQWVCGIRRARPPIFSMFCSWCMARITAPEPRKSRALKKAWVPRWKSAAAYPPQPAARNM
jgi:hypothetical protein